MEKYDSFTMPAKFGEILGKLEFEDRKLLAAAIVEYAYFGTDIELPYPLELVMVTIKDDIDDSRGV